ncbi:deoxyguanosinetriphosphate triphosphohydrolase family protein [Chloroflexota bacterium]
MKMIATSQKGELAKRRYKDEPQIGDIRTPFQHDKDRIIHSTAFRRLQYKTQVYVIHEGDLYRTRLTHSLEVAQIAGGIALQLGADPDLAEAIALAHDLGHAPFGHIGGNTLRDLLVPFGILFDHNVQSYRIVTVLEERYTSFKGLNLTYATLEGILRHRTYFDNEEEILANIPNELKEEVSSFWNHKQPIIEAQIVNIADSIAYATHDLEDALEVGLLEWAEFKTLVDKYDITFVIGLSNDDLHKAIEQYKQANGETNEKIVRKVKHRTLSRLIINKLILETVAQTKKNLDEFNCNGEQLTAAVRDSRNVTIALPTALEKQLRNLLSRILFDHVYREPRVMIMMQKAKRILETIFSACMEAPEALPNRTQAKLETYYQLDKKKRASKPGRRILARAVGDYISGMTDKYAMDTYQLLTQAYEKAL